MLHGLQPSSPYLSADGRGLCSLHAPGYLVTVLTAHGSDKFHSKVNSFIPS